MRILTYILLLFSLSGFSQSVKVDSPKGLISDLPEVSCPATTDIIIIERNDSSKRVAFENVNPSDHVYMGFTDSAVVLAITKDTWTQVTNIHDSLFVVKHENGLDYIDGDSVKVTLAGTYKVSGNLSYKGANNELWKIAVRRTRAGVTTTQGFPLHKYTGANNTVSISLACVTTACIADDILTLEIMNTSDNDDCTLISCNFIARFFHR